MARIIRSTQQRTYLCKSNGQERTIRGGFSFGAFDAAKKFAAAWMPGYEVVPSNRTDRFDAINHGSQRGALIWVTEQ